MKISLVKCNYATYQITCQITSQINELLDKKDT